MQTPPVYMATSTTSAVGEAVKEVSRPSLRPPLILTATAPRKIGYRREAITNTNCTISMYGGGFVPSVHTSTAAERGSESEVANLNVHPEVGSVKLVRFEP